MSRFDRMLTALLIAATGLWAVTLTICTAVLVSKS